MLTRVHLPATFIRALLTVCKGVVCFSGTNFQDSQIDFPHFNLWYLDKALTVYLSRITIPACILVWWQQTRDGKWCISMGSKILLVILYLRLVIAGTPLTNELSARTCGAQSSTPARDRDRGSHASTQPSLEPQENSSWTGLNWQQLFSVAFVARGCMKLPRSKLNLYYKNVSFIEF